MKINKLMKAFLVLMLVAIPTQGFCFPEVPRHMWVLDNLYGFWEEPQYTTGNDCLDASSGVSINGISRGYNISIHGLAPNTHYKEPICGIGPGCSRQFEYYTTDIERYPDVWNDVEKNPDEDCWGEYWVETEFIFCNFPDEGRLIVKISWKCRDRDHPLGPFKRMTHAFCFWQTLEMMEASLN